MTTRSAGEVSTAQTMLNGARRALAQKPKELLRFSRLAVVLPRLQVLCLIRLWGLLLPL